jgi:hypothetical protein
MDFTLLSAAISAYGARYLYSIDPCLSPRAGKACALDLAWVTPKLPHVAGSDT